MSVRESLGRVFVTAAEVHEETVVWTPGFRSLGDRIAAVARTYGGLSGPLLVSWDGERRAWEVTEYP